MHWRMYINLVERAFLWKSFPDVRNKKRDWERSRLIKTRNLCFLANFGEDLSSSKTFFNPCRQPGGQKEGRWRRKMGGGVKRWREQKAAAYSTGPSTSFIPIDISTKSRMQHKLSCKKLIRKVPRMLTSSASDYLVHIFKPNLIHFKVKKSLLQ